MNGAIPANAAFIVKPGEGSSYIGGDNGTRSLAVNSPNGSNTGTGTLVFEVGKNMTPLAEAGVNIRTGNVDVSKFALSLLIDGEPVPYAGDQEFYKVVGNQVTFFVPEDAPEGASIGSFTIGGSNFAVNGIFATGMPVDIDPSAATIFGLDDDSSLASLLGADDDPESGDIIGATGIVSADGHDTFAWGNGDLDGGTTKIMDFHLGGDHLRFADIIHFDSDIDVLLAKGDLSLTATDDTNLVLRVNDGQGHEKTVEIQLDQNVDAAAINNADSGQATELLHQMIYTESNTG